MQSDALRSYSDKMYVKAQKIAEAGLSDRPTPDELMKVAADVEGAIDIQVHRFAGKLEVLNIQQGVPTIACRKGCSFCCGTQIMCTIPEALRMARWFQENFDAEQMAALRARLVKFREFLLGIQGAGLPRPPYDCAVLFEDSCSGHPGRPIACRGANSLDVDACIRAREHWQDDSVQIPLLGQPYYAGKSMVQAINHALERRGVKSPVVELGLALEIALEHPDAAERFLAGDSLFDIAIVPDRAPE